MKMHFINKQPLKVLVSVLVIPVFMLTSCGDKTVPHQRGGMLKGAPNFRDLGGYPSSTGKQTIWQKVFRSQTLAQLSDSDMVTIKALGIDTVIDFRGDDEVRKEPSRLPEGLRIVRLPIDVGSSDTLPIMQRLMSGTLDSTQCITFMQTANRKFAVEFTSQYKEFFNILLQPENYPVVFHCTAGKDRTGFAAAMLLSALDVDWNTVMNDYLLTNQYLKPQQLMLQIPEQAMPAFRQMWGVQPSYLNAAKEEIIKRYNSIDNYLRQELNVGKAERNKLKQYLLK